MGRLVRAVDRLAELRYTHHVLVLFYVVVVLVSLTAGNFGAALVFLLLAGLAVFRIIGKNHLTTGDDEGNVKP